MFSILKIYFGYRLHKPCRNGNIKTVKRLLFVGADVNVKGELFGSTPLHNAVIGGHTEIVELLIIEGARVNAKMDEDGSTPLHCPKSKEIAELLIDNGADVNAQDSIKSTPLHYAALNGEMEIVELLLTKGVDVNAKGPRGVTALDFAEENIAKARIWLSPERKAEKKETANLLRKHGGKTGAELKAEGK
jgi:ankyrin repeat protein